MRPRIGITTSYEDGTQSLSRRYVTAVERAGGTPLPLPMPDTAAPYDDLAPLLDGLIVIGGPAVTEGLVGALADELSPPSDRRSASDRGWLDRVWDRGRPILGICYGMQLLNARAGGALYGDVERQREAAQSHSQKRDAAAHPVHLAPSSLLRDVVGQDTLTVNTRHLQALASLGDGFSVAARAPDGVIEAIEHENGRVLGVQFHPERMGDVMAPLFRHFVAQAAQEPAPSPPPPAA
ncbi:MAG: gamma-glutamyl-gamma-aminobutyrate hydrolase family protein [Salinibacter sp.]